MADAYLSPDYNPKTWALGYQSRQFGVASDPVPTGTEPAVPLQYSGTPYPSAYSAMANPTAGLTTAIEMAIDTAPVITPDQ